MISCLCWNIRGIGNSPSVRRLISLCKSHKVQIAAILEHMIDNLAMQRISCRLGLKNFTSSNNSLSKVWLFWSDKITLDIVNCQDNFITVAVNNAPIAYYITFIYASSHLHDKISQFQILSGLASTINGPWMVMGDFNSILYSHEKFGGNPPSQPSVNAFHGFLQDNSLTDLSFTGSPFTWRNGQTGPGYIRARLDRGVANPLWFDKAVTNITHLHHIYSDHNLLLVYISFTNYLHASHFKFLKMWTRHPSFI